MVTPMSEPRVGWLHVTDLHAGLGPLDWLWPNIRDAFLEDLAVVHEQSGPWDVILFTGDLTQRGTADEMAEGHRVLDGIRERAAELGSDPVLLAVPGNHDLIRPDENSGVRALADGWDDAPRREHFWTVAGGELRAGVAAAFAHWDQSFLDDPALTDVRRGLLPGDFAATLTRRGLRIGVVGLNTAFLQLAPGDFEGRLTLDSRQLMELCPEGGGVWAGSHDVTFLLTHHPRSWLDERGQEELRREISPAGQFTAHLCGHEHQGYETITIQGAGIPRCEMLGRSLFGLETWGEEPGRRHRIHGYAAGTITVLGASHQLRHWPRRAIAKADGWGLGPDPEGHTEADGGTRPIELGKDSPRAISATPADDDTDARPEPAEPIPGWVAITPAFVEEHAAGLSAVALGHYFDGAIPGWAHGRDAAIPRLGVVHELAERATKAASEGFSQALLLIGPSGEGKTTGLFQAAVELVTETGAQVLWWRDTEGAFDAAAVLALPPGPWILVFDDAAPRARSVYRVLRDAHIAGRADLVFLLAARDTDWRFAKGDRHPWGEMLDKVPVHGLGEDDAKAIVRSWAAAGAEHLRELRRLPTEEERVEELLAAASGARSSLFGAILKVRFSPAGLRAHVLSVMERFADEPMGPGRTLRDAFLAIASAEVAGLDGLHRSVFAAMAGSPPRTVLTSGIRQLGEEAVAQGGTNLLRVRHPDIAQAAIGLAETDDIGDDLAEVYSSLVTATIHAAETTSIDSAWVGGVRTLGRHLPQKLPKPVFDADRREEIALAAAEALQHGQPRLLVGHIAVARTYRALDLPREGAATLRAVNDRLDRFADLDRRVREYWYEWSVCQGRTGDHLGSVVLASTSLSDSLGPVSISRENAKKALAGLGAAFVELIGDEGADQNPYAAGLAAISLLGGATDPDPKTRTYFAQFARKAKEQRAVTPTTMRQAIDVIEDLVRETAETWDDDAGPDADATALTFEALYALLVDRRPSRRPARTRGPLLPGT